MTSHDVRLHGHGGGGKSGKSGGASEAANTLRSSQTLRLLGLIGEGVTGGLVNGAKSIYANDVAVQNEDGTYNYEGVSFESRNGYPDQTYLAGFPAVETEQSVGIEVKQDVPIIQSVTNLDATAVRVSIQIPSLLFTDNETGDVRINSVDIMIDTRPDGGTFTSVKYDRITGKCTSPYVRSYRIPLTGAGPWYVRVRRLSEDSNGTTNNSATYWSSMTVIEDYQLTYPDSSIIGLVVNAAQFGSSSVPKISCDWRGLEILVPSNYNTTTRAYSGVWNGTFTYAVSDNPAWVFYDLATNDRYGLGQFIDTTEVDKWALYEIAQYCDQLVPNGNGGTEPRFTFNGVISSRDEAINVLTALAGVFRGMNFWGSGSLTVVCDKPSDPVKVVTRANVVDGTFTYQGTALSARHTQVMIQWHDPEDSYKSAIEVVEDVDAIEKYGARQTEIQAIGCTSRGQAHRYGTWLLDTEQNETEVVTYRAGLDHADVVPGDVVLIADPSYAGVRFGGRLAGVSEDLLTLTLDAPVTLGSGETYTVTAVMPDGSLADRTVTNSAGTGSTLTISVALPAIPVSGAMWILTGSDVAPRPFRVLTVTENSKHQFDISALFYDETKYARVEQNLALERPSFSAYPIGPLLAPTNPTVSESLYLAGNVTVRTQVTIGWTPANDARVDVYEIQYAVDDVWAAAGTTSSASFDISDLSPGIYGFRVRSRSRLNGSVSTWLTLSSVLINGVNIPPANVTGFVISSLGDISTLAWNAVTSLNNSHYVIRYSPELTGAGWSSSVVQLSRVDGTSVQIPSRTGTYLIKSVSRQGVESSSATLISTNVGGNSFNAVDTISATPEWGGTFYQTEVDGGSLQLSSDVDGFYLSGSYTDSAIIDLGDVYVSRVTPLISAYGDNVNNVMSTWLTLSSLSDLTGIGQSAWAAFVEIRTTDDDPLGTPAWSDWYAAPIGDISARAYEMRVKLSSSFSYVTPVVTRADLSVDMPDRLVSGNDLSVVTSGLRVDFSPPYKDLTGVAISAQGLSTGDYYLITSKDETGFNIIFRDAAGSAVERTFDYVATGYGKRAV